jgi:hypothetical protein
MSYESEAAGLVAEFKGVLDSALGASSARFQRLEDSIQRIEQRGYRLGVPTGNTPAAGNQQLLEASKELKTWLGQPRGKKSSISVSVPFEMKAAVPALNVGGTVHYPYVTGPQKPALRLAQLLPQIPLALGAAVEYTQETGYTPAAAVVAEGATKPATNLTFQNKLAAIQTVATITKVSVQSLMDVPDIQRWLDMRLMYAVLLAAEDLFLNGTGALLASATALDVSYAPGGTPTSLDLIGAAISQLQANGYTVDGVVMNGVDASKARLLKTSYGEYLWASPDSAIGTSAVWSVPTIISPKIAAGTALVGAFTESTLLFVRQLLTVEISFENEDDFVKNLACLRAEERVALAIPNPAGLVKVTGLTATSANEAPPKHSK